MLTGFGVDMVIDRVARGLGERGHEVTVYASVTDETLSSDHYQLKLVPTQASPFFPRSDLAAQRHLGFLNSEGNEVYFVETFPFFSCLPRLKAATVAVDHGVSSAEGFPVKIRANISYMRFMQYRFYLKYASRIVMVSEYLKSGLPLGLQKKTTVIYNGADHYSGVDDSADDSLRRKLGIDRNVLLLLYVGRLNSANQPYKGTAELVEMYGRLRQENPNIRLLMVGFGNRRDRAWLESEGVLTIINAPAEQMPEIFSTCDIYVTASRWEGFDLPIVEAQSFGKPVVGLNIGAHPEVVAAEKSGFLATSAEGMAEAIKRLAADDDLRRKMGQEAESNAARFRWDDTVDQYERLLHEVVS
jgi:glycosyltransferase involved in cell wall biosynthesis